MLINTMEKNRVGMGRSFTQGAGCPGSLMEEETDKQELGGDEGGRPCVFGERVIPEEEPARAKALRWGNV